MEPARAHLLRRHERVQVLLPVSYGVGAVERSDLADSISAGGLSIKTNNVYQVGTRLVLHVAFPGRTICHRGEVTWAIRVPDHLSDRMMCGMGISFLDSDPDWPEFFRRWAEARGAELSSRR